MSRRLTIDPVTRVEGHGTIHLFLDEAGRVERARLQIPEFRGFEKLCEGRAAEEMPALTAKVCGICPTAHHLCSAKALDRVFQAEPPVAGRLLRELLHSAFIFEDHALHFFALAGPDLLLSPGAGPAERNFFGVLRSLGAETGRRLLEVRARVRSLSAVVGGSPLYPVCALPGGMSRPVTPAEREPMVATADEAVAFARFALALFEERCLGNPEYRRALADETLCHRTYYLGTVDGADRASLYDGTLRVVGPDGAEFARFRPEEYAHHLAERVEPDSYAKDLYLRQVGWRGHRDGAGSGVYRVGPLARLNAAAGMTTPLAHAEFERFFDALGGRPVHNVLAYHWARLVELLHAAERLAELTRDERLTDPEVRALRGRSGGEGVGACEAPRGTLIHHYRTDGRGLLESVNLLVGTQNNHAALCLDLGAAARRHLQGPVVTEAARNAVEAVVRAYDPCFACTTHALGGGPGDPFRVYDAGGRRVWPATAAPD